MVIEKSIAISRRPEDVFAFVSDPRNDPLWCPKVQSVEPTDAGGGALGPGASFLVIHRPIPLRPQRRMEYELVAWDPPRRIDWREDDGHDRIAVSYLLEREGEATRFRQRDEAELGAARILWPLMRAGIGADIARQLRLLRRHLESDPSASSGAAR